MGNPDNATNEQLKAVLENVNKIRTGIQQALLLPLFADVEEQISKLSVGMNNFVKGIERGEDVSEALARTFGAGFTQVKDIKVPSQFGLISSTIRILNENGALN